MERANIIGYIFNDGNKTRIINNNNKIKRDHNNNQEDDLEEACDTTRSELGRYRITTTSETGSILIAGILNVTEGSRTVNNNTNTDSETVQVVDFI